MNLKYYFLSSDPIYCVNSLQQVFVSRIWKFFSWTTENVDAETSEEYKVETEEQSEDECSGVEERCRGVWVRKNPEKIKDLASPLGNYLYLEIKTSQ